MRYAQSFVINAPPGVVWAIIADLEKWPGWAPTFEKMEFPGDRELRRGLRVRLTVRGAPTSEWVVTEYDEGRRFAWETTARGIHSIGDHIIEPAADGTRLTLVVESTGFMSRLFAPMIRRVSKRNVPLEGNGLKVRAEAAAAVQ
jgi:carbon monoxide dehydrogenase subunit G